MIAEIMVVAASLTSDARNCTGLAQPGPSAPCAVETAQHVAPCGVAEARRNRTYRRKSYLAAERL
jgi:hypothetical protein